MKTPAQSTYTRRSNPKSHTEKCVGIYRRQGLVTGHWKKNVDCECTQQQCDITIKSLKDWLLLRLLVWLVGWGGGVCFANDREIYKVKWSSPLTRYLYFAFTSHGNGAHSGSDITRLSEES